MDWPAHVPTVGPDFNIRHLNADELHALVVPFPKEQMGVDYHAKAPGEEEDQDGPMIVPSSSFHLKKWTPEQSRLFRLADSQMFSIPLVVNMSNEPLHILSDSQAFLRALPRGLLPPRNWLSSSLPPSSPPEELPQPAQSNPSSPSPADKSPQLPVRRHVHDSPTPHPQHHTCNHHRDHQFSESDNDASPPQGRNHHRYVLVLALTLQLTCDGIV
ncbi:hypothetical protein EDD16DRAFT_1709018 [Pisolithus croceorrhizus]|nr:hypothetical protein EV401DRAFT_2075504 [Pisolithus croceorrhizus]KAI6114995.1 hypothetical protein EDD16DRAFT_1709018 [Pisolithus croceorrhizus]KAI6154322.1 hypothetical protein EDD17DRAFT_1765042 [Pisolithus thermaeus]